MKLILHSDDINLLNHWENSFTGYKIVDDFKNLFDAKDSIIVLNYTSFLKDIATAIKTFSANNNYVLVLHRDPSLAVAKKLLKSGVKGYGNAYMRTHFLISAAETIKDGLVWLYPEYTTQIILELEDKSNNQNQEILTKLTPREQEVALLVKDGLTCKEIAAKLDIGVRTAKTHIQHTYAKLHVNDRLALALLLK